MNYEAVIKKKISDLINFRIFDIENVRFNLFLIFDLGNVRFNLFSIFDIENVGFNHFQYLI